MREHLLLLSGLAVDKARANGDGNGDHARAMAAYLTGVQPRKTNGTDIRAGISADQLAASRIGHLTRLPSLEIGCEPPAVAGGCDPGYACVYTSTMSWRSETQPLPKEIDPRIVFERLFVDGPEKKSAAINQRRKSVDRRAGRCRERACYGSPFQRQRESPTLGFPPPTRNHSFIDIKRCNSESS